MGGGGTYTGNLQPTGCHLVRDLHALCIDYATENGYTYLTWEDVLSSGSNHGSCGTWAQGAECVNNQPYMWSNGNCKQMCLRYGSPSGCVRRGNDVWFNRETTSRACGYAGVECISLNTQDLMKIRYNTGSNNQPCSHSLQCMQYNEVIQDYKLDGEKQSGTWQINEKGSFTPSESSLLERKLIEKAKEENLIAIFAVYALYDGWKSWLATQTVLSKHYNIPVIETDQQMLQAVVTTGERKRDALFYMNPKSPFGDPAYAGTSSQGKYSGMFGHNFKLNGPIPTDNSDDCYLKVSLTSSTQSLDSCFNLFPECTQMCQQMHGFVQACGGTCQPGYVSTEPGVVEFDKSLTVTQNSVTDIHKNAYATLGHTAVCEKCPLGTFRNNGHLQIAKQSNRISIIFGTTHPFSYRAPQGSIDPSRDMSMCQPCLSGWFPAFEQDICHQCPIGTFSDNYVKPNNYCTTCTVGKFNPYKGSLTCLTCANRERTAFSLVQLEGDEDYVPPRHLTLQECRSFAVLSGDPNVWDFDYPNTFNDYYIHPYGGPGSGGIDQSSYTGPNNPPGCFVVNPYKNVWPTGVTNDYTAGMPRVFYNSQLSSTKSTVYLRPDLKVLPIMAVAKDYDPQKLLSTSSLGNGTSFSISHNANWDKYIHYYITDNLPMSKLWQNFTIPEQKNPVAYCAKVCHNGAIGIPSSKDFIYFPEDNKCKCALPILTPDLMFYEPTSPDTVETCLGTPAPTNTRNCQIYGPKKYGSASFKYFKIHEQFNFESATEICDKDDEDFDTEISGSTGTHAYDGYIGVENNVQLDISNAYGEAAEVCNKKCPQDNIKFFAYGECEDFYPTFQEVVLKNVHQTNYYSQKDVGIETCRDYCNTVVVPPDADTWEAAGPRRFPNLDSNEGHWITTENECCTSLLPVDCRNLGERSLYEGGCIGPSVPNAYSTTDPGNVIYYEQDGKSWANNKRCEDRCFTTAFRYVYAYVVKLVYKDTVGTYNYVTKAWSFHEQVRIEWRCYCKYSDVDLTQDIVYSVQTNYDECFSGTEYSTSTGNKNCVLRFVPIQMTKRTVGAPFIGGFQIHFVKNAINEDRMDMVCSCIDGQGLNDCRVTNKHDILSTNSKYNQKFMNWHPLMKMDMVLRLKSTTE